MLTNDSKLHTASIEIQYQYDEQQQNEITTVDYYSYILNLQTVNFYSFVKQGTHSENCSRMLTAKLPPVLELQWGYRSMTTDCHKHM